MASPIHDHDVGRRALLTAAGLAMPALLATAACSREAGHHDRGGEHEEGGEDEVTANEDLMREHGVLRRVLIVYREAGPLIVSGARIDVGALNQAATLFRAFGEQYHEKMLEEAYVFPAVQKAGGAAAQLPDILLAQHERGRQITDYIIDQTKAGAIATGQAAAMAKAITGFARMYEAHSAREDTVVFPAFKRTLGEHRFKELGEQFEEIEHKQFGADGFDAALSRVGAIEQALGLSDLSHFTAALPVG